MSIKYEERLSIELDHEIRPLYGILLSTRPFYTPVTHIVSLVSNLTATSIPLDIATKTANLPGLEVTVAAFHDDTVPEHCDLSVVPLQARGRFDIDAFYRLFRLLQRDDVDVLHTHENFLGSVARSLGTVASVGTINTEHRQHNSFSPLQNAVNVPTISLADRVVANSNATKQSLLLPERLMLDPDQIRVIYNGVDVDRIASTITDGTVQTETDGMQIITVGRLVDVKNQKLLLQAFSRMTNRFPGAQLTIVGDGPLRDDLTEQTRLLGIQNQVRFSGEISRREVYRQLAGSDLFVMPSISEGFCVAVIEAMAAGLPVVVSDIDVFHEVVGDPGVFADPNDPESFANAISDLLQQPEKRDKLGKEAKDRARSTFTLDRTAREYSNLYKEVAKNSN